MLSGEYPLLMLGAETGAYEESMQTKVFMKILAATYITLIISTLTVSVLSVFLFISNYAD